jgi:hypothetical protein
MDQKLFVLLLSGKQTYWCSDCMFSVGVFTINTKILNIAKQLVDTNFRNIAIIVVFHELTVNV